MRNKTFSQRLKSMTLEKKALSIVSLLTIISCFLPWYGINSRVINQWWNAFGSIGSVAGYVVLTFAVLSLAILMASVIRPNLDLSQKLPISESALLTFLQAQSFFVALLFIPVYSQYSLINATNSGTRFGIYMALISTLVGTLVAIAAHRKAGQLQMKTQEFASVPRQHNAIQDWSDQDEEPFEAAESEEFEQESIFESAQEPSVPTENSYTNQNRYSEDEYRYE